MLLLSEEKNFSYGTDYFLIILIYFFEGEYYSEVSTDF